jgi:competence protein ComEC
MGEVGVRPLNWFMKKYLALGIMIVLFFAGLSIYQAVQFNDGKLHVIICDVGQGDGVIIRTPDRRVILFDGGPDKKVLGCLSRTMPFWERQIDLMILSHPHADHLNGLVDVLKSYSVGQFATEALANSSDGFSALESSVKKEGLVWQTLLDGDTIKVSRDVKLTVVGPTGEYLQKTSVDGHINSNEFASLELLLSYGNFTLLLTGDSQYQQMNQAILAHPDLLSQITVLQEPHHGSRTGITPEIIKVLSPELATISVGAKNTYGHPALRVLSILKDAGVRIARTDKEGELKLITDGKSYNLQ